jgi:hypothetical protein
LELVRILLTFAAGGGTFRVSHSIKEVAMPLPEFDQALLRIRGDELSAALVVQADGVFPTEEHTEEELEAAQQAVLMALARHLAPKRFRDEADNELADAIVKATNDFLYYQGSDLSERTQTKLRDEWILPELQKHVP